MARHSIRLLQGRTINAYTGPSIVTDAVEGDQETPSVSATSENERATSVSLLDGFISVEYEDGRTMVMPLNNVISYETTYEEGEAH